MKTESVADAVPEVLPGPGAPGSRCDASRGAVGRSNACGGGRAAPRPAPDASGSTCPAFAASEPGRSGGRAGARLPTAVRGEARARRRLLPRYERRTTQGLGSYHGMRRHAHGASPRTAVWRLTVPWPRLLPRFERRSHRGLISYRGMALSSVVILVSTAVGRRVYVMDTTHTAVKVRAMRRSRSIPR